MAKREIKCATHKLPISECAECYPVFLRETTVGDVIDEKLSPVIVMPDQDGNITVTVEELREFIAHVRNMAFSEVLIKVTDKLDPTDGASGAQLAYVDVLKTVNLMRTDEVDIKVEAAS